jgi:hypothetical protein
MSGTTGTVRPPSTGLLDSNGQVVTAWLSFFQSATDRQSNDDARITALSNRLATAEAQLANALDREVLLEAQMVAVLIRLADIEAHYLRIEVAP